MTQPPTQLEAASVAELLTRSYEHAYEQGWTDGLPIIPATPEAVKQFVAASGRQAGDLIALLPPRKGRATVEVIAVNAIMAGCRRGGRDGPDVSTGADAGHHQPDDAVPAGKRTCAQ